MPGKAVGVISGFLIILEGSCFKALVVDFISVFEVKLARLPALYSLLKARIQ